MTNLTKRGLLVAASLLIGAGPAPAQLRLSTLPKRAEVADVQDEAGRNLVRPSHLRGRDAVQPAYAV